MRGRQRLLHGESCGRSGLGRTKRSRSTDAGIVLVLLPARHVSCSAGILPVGRREKGERVGVGGEGGKGSKDGRSCEG